MGKKTDLPARALQRCTGKTTRKAEGARRRCGVLARAAALAVLAGLVAGCGGAPMTPHPQNAIFSIVPVNPTIDTNCTGCNTPTARGGAAHQFHAVLADGAAAAVKWSVTGGDAEAGPGTISAGGQYVPPAYLTASRAHVLVRATLKADPAVTASFLLSVAPGFLQPLSPENAALGPGGTLTVTGYMAATGGASTMRFTLADTPKGSSGGLGRMSAPVCTRGVKSYIACSAEYTAPAMPEARAVTYVVASIDGSPARTETAILLNAAGIVSNPAAHQAAQSGPILLGASGGNNGDYDAAGSSIADCCGGTLGALVEGTNGRQYVLSANHVLARSDRGSAGDAVIQPGLIDNNCTPMGTGSRAAPVAALTAWLPLEAAQTNTDAALALVGSRTVDAAGGILELGARQGDGALGAAPPGTSSTGGRGETAALDLRVAKSGRTTGLTCGGVSALGVDISVDYYRDCAETKPYLTRRFTNQIAVSGNRFSDAGDSGALLVDAANAEPVGLFFAGGVDQAGVGQGVATAAPEVLAALGAQVGSGLSFVGGQDHPVSCLSYGDSTVAAAQAQALSDAEIGRARRALAAARMLVNPTLGVLGTALGKSSDRPGEAAVLVYVAEGMQPAVPATVEGVRTVVLTTTARAMALGTAPLVHAAGGAALAPAALAQALAAKQNLAHGLMTQNAAFFGVGVGQSLDNPREAALVVYVDRTRMPAKLAPVLGGLRVRYIVMDRMHVTRSYALPARGMCSAR